ncbi:oligosaccharide flippase family protein [Roseivivax sp. GX 12232]|uniref:lipopolysaccharide biosynthesis protein n=1 Tax=Roseivivax sp. GX 12232 TaxID=2900547 RepID=UPI001E52AD8E|nr:oligosaccharide flippase family protein [Roseivivax sp. GX 12232]MCE0506584.1 oligosaccharide flippase family protein [Roseivivax sp. GX 12232]
MIYTRFATVLQTGGAAAAAQLMVLVTLPIAARLFDETAFGVLGLMVTMSNILTVVMHLGYVDAVIAANTDENADDIVRLVLGIIMLTFVPLAALIYVVIINDLLGYGEMPYWTIGPILIQSAAIAAGFTFQQRIIRDQRYRVLAGSHLALGGGRSIGQIAGGVLLPTTLGLVMAEMFSRCAMAGFVISRCSRSLWCLWPRRGPILRMAVDFRSYAAMRAAGTFLNMLNVSLPTLIVAQNFSLLEVGFISFTLAIIYAPIGLIQKALGDIFTGTYRALLEIKVVQARRLFWQALGLLSVLGIFAGGVLHFFSEPLFNLIFGDKWAVAGLTAQRFAPLIAAMTVVLPLSTSLNILRRADVSLFFNGARLLLLIGALVLVEQLGLNYLQTVSTIVIPAAIAYLAYGVTVIVINEKFYRAPPLR